MIGYDLLEIKSLMSVCAMWTYVEFFLRSNKIWLKNEGIQVFVVIWWLCSRLVITTWVGEVG